MKSKERVLETINYGKPDRVPINFVGANEAIDKMLRLHFNGSADNFEPVLQGLKVDFRTIELPYTGPKIHSDVEGYVVNQLWGLRMKWIENQSGGYWDYCNFPLKDAQPEQIKGWNMPNPDDFDYSAIALQCQKYKDYAIVYGSPGMVDIINNTGMLFGMEQTLIDLISENSITLEFLERKNKIECAILDRVLNASKGGIDIVWMGEDLGTQLGPMISLDIFRKHIRPEHQKIVDIANHYQVKTMFHSCGSNSWAFDDLIEMGIDIVDTLQPEAENMNPQYLKKKFGKKLCYNGCISTAGPIAYGTVAETVEYVKSTLDIMKQGGGYIFAPTHMLQDNSPVSNVIAAYIAAVEYGGYDWD